MPKKKREEWKLKRCCRRIVDNAGRGEVFPNCTGEEGTQHSLDGNNASACAPGDEGVEKGVRNAQ